MRKQRILMPVEAELRVLTAQIVAAYLSKNPLDAPLDRKTLETSVYDALAECAEADPGPVKRTAGEAAPSSERLAARRRSTFRERDVRAAITATERAGKQVSAVEIGCNGSIKILVGKHAAPETLGVNEWDAGSK